MKAEILNNKTTQPVTIDTNDYNWVCTWTGTKYEYNDPLLIGQGNPPSAPCCPPGVGPITLILTKKETPLKK